MLNFYFTEDPKIVPVPIHELRDHKVSRELKMLYQITNTVAVTPLKIY
jgi:hypothetical protein